MLDGKFDDIFDLYVHGANTYEDAFKDALDYVGCELIHIPSKKYCERFYGFKVAETGGSAKVTAIYPGSIADIAELRLGDEIMLVNDMQIKGDGSGTNLNEWLVYFGERPVKIIVSNQGVARITRLIITKEEYYPQYHVHKKQAPSDAQKKNYQLWSKHNF